MGWRPAICVLQEEPRSEVRGREPARGPRRTGEELPGRASSEPVQGWVRLRPSVPSAHPTPILPFLLAVPDKRQHVPVSAARRGL